MEKPLYIYSLHDIYDVVKKIAGRELTEQEYFNLNNMLFSMYSSPLVEAHQKKQNPGEMTKELYDFLTKWPPYKGELRSEENECDL